MGVSLYTVGVGEAMPKLFVTCPECDFCGELAHSDQEFDDPSGKCKYLLNPAECPSLHVPLVAARRMLDLLQWDSLLAAELTAQDLPSRSIIP